MTAQIITLTYREARPRGILRSIVRGFAAVLHILVLLIGGIAIAILAIATLLDAGVRSLERRAA